MFVQNRQKNLHFLAQDEQDKRPKFQKPADFPHAVSTNQPRKPAAAERSASHSVSYFLSRKFICMSSLDRPSAPLPGLLFHGIIKRNNMSTRVRTVFCGISTHLPPSQGGIFYATSQHSHQTSLFGLQHGVCLLLLPRRGFQPGNCF